MLKNFVHDNDLVMGNGSLAVRLMVTINNSTENGINIFEKKRPLLSMARKLY